MKKRRRLLWRLFPSYLLITLISLLAVSWYASEAMRHFFLDQTAIDLKARAVLLEKQISGLLSPLNADAIDSICKEAGRLSATSITVILPNGSVIGDSRETPHLMDNHANRPEIITALAGQTGKSMRFSNTLMQQMHYVAVPIKDGQQIVAVLRTALPATAVEAEIRSIRLKIGLGGCIIALLAAGISWVISRRISQPIEQMKKSAEHFAAGDLNHRLTPPGTEEMGGLADAMNQMAAQLNERIETIVNQRNQLQTVLASMTEGVIAIDTEERIVSINQAAARLFEYEPLDCQGKSIQEIIRSPALQQFIRQALSSKIPSEEDITLFQNEERVIDVKGSPLLDANQHQIGTLVVFHDVTQLRRLEDMRRDFVANVSHEIKTPLTAIKGFVETLQQGKVEKAQEKERFLGIIQKHVDRLNAIIEDLLALSRIEQEDENKEIEFEPVKISDVFQAAIQLCRPKADEKNIRINLNCEKQATANFDPTLIEQAVVNLLDNAIKFSDPGSTVQVESHHENDQIVIRVQDQGIGIAQKHLPRLFERFYRIDKARSRNMGGTGLGLAIVKHIAQAHGGYVMVESRLGEGSCFSIHLPQKVLSTASNM
ncbi:MAG: PAS domain-containing protein [Deltaproteobacteria bacterium]|jgi:two-component system phosphate regulon sensor histidine kinase PhoR|nr:PAS domain-containing protein [Deltaproteobacteria bacterium]